MDRLLSPDTGLIIWTVVTFLILVVVLKKFAWGPLIAAIEDREAKLKADRDAAQTARGASEQLKAELESEIAALEARGREVLSRAAKEGEELRLKLQAAASAEARKIKEKALAELVEEKERLVGELRREVADLSVLAAGKLLQKSVDAGVERKVLDSFFAELDAAPKGRPGR
jgi:F-type H+-transporting ATPase subunit b